MFFRMAWQEGAYDLLIDMLKGAYVLLIDMTGRSLCSSD